MRAYGGGGGVNRITHRSLGAGGDCRGTYPCGGAYEARGRRGEGEHEEAPVVDAVILLEGDGMIPLDFLRTRITI